MKQKQTVRSQHYVWQHYLRSWTNNENNRVKVYDYIEKKEFFTNTENILQESFFYSSNNLSKSSFDNMIKLLTNFVKDTKKEEDVYAVLSTIDLHIGNILTLLELKEMILQKSEFCITDILGEGYYKDREKMVYSPEIDNYGSLIKKLIFEKTEQMKIMINKSIAESCPVIICSYQKDIETIINFMNLLKESDCNSNETLEFLNKHIELINKDLVEKLHSQYEKMALEYLTSLNNRSAAFFKNDQEKLFFISFICIQLGRTKKVFTKFDNNVIQSFNTIGKELNSKEKEFIDDIVDLKPYYYFLQSKFLSPYLDKFFNKLTFLYSDGSLEFVTGDQPVVPIRSDKDTNNFKIYYPISPRISIVLSHSDSNELIIDDDILTDIEIEKFNEMVERECQRYVIKKNSN